MIDAIKRFLGIRTPADDYAAGRAYAAGQIEHHGADNMYEMDRLWTECDCSFDKNQFDRGMQDELSARKIPGPDDARWNQ